MGYTHYFTTTGASLTKDRVDGIFKNISKVFKLHKNIVQREYNDSSPAEVGIALNLKGRLAIGIWLNGKGEDGHETFAINTGAQESSFCKTARKPYDIVVCKILLILKYYLGDNIEVGSDGFSTHQPQKKYSVGNVVKLRDVDGTWGSAVRSVNRMLGTKYKFVVDSVYGNGDCYFSYKLNL